MLPHNVHPAIQREMDERQARKRQRAAAVKEAAESGEFSLLNLTQDQRDELIDTISFVDEPHCFEFSTEDLRFFDSLRVWNYSLFYEQLSAEAKLRVPDVANFRTGDMMMTGGYRGVGSFYGVWLHKNLFENNAVSHAADQAICERPLYRQFTGRAPGAAAEDNDDGDDGEYDEDERGEATPTAHPRLVPREADGPHNDGLHHFYLFSHIDEMGYSSSTAMSNAPEMYHSRCREYDCAHVDPVLTHSKSYFGQRIAEAAEEHEDDPQFPLGYFVNLDTFESDDLEFVDDEDSISAQGDGCFTEVRNVFTKHFEQVHVNTSVLLK